MLFAVLSAHAQNSMAEEIQKLRNNLYEHLMFFWMFDAKEDALKILELNPKDSIAMAKLKYIEEYVEPIKACRDSFLIFQKELWEAKGVFAAATTGAECSKYYGGGSRESAPFQEWERAANSGSLDSLKLELDQYYNKRYWGEVDRLANLILWKDSTDNFSKIQLEHAYAAYEKDSGLFNARLIELYRMYQGHIPIQEELLLVPHGSIFGGSLEFDFLIESLKARLKK